MTKATFAIRMPIAAFAAGLLHLSGAGVAAAQSVESDVTAESALLAGDYTTFNQDDASREQVGVQHDDFDGVGTLTYGKTKESYVYEMVGDAANLPGSLGRVGTHCSLRSGGSQRQGHGRG